MSLDPRVTNVENVRDCWFRRHDFALVGCVGARNRVGRQRNDQHSRETAVLESDRTLRHVAFFEELAALDESDAEWRSVSAGLVVLRLVDAWMEEGSHAVSGDAWGLRAVRVSIEEVDAGSPVRALLASVVDAME